MSHDLHKFAEKFEQQKWHQLPYSTDADLMETIRQNLQQTGVQSVSAPAANQKQATFKLPLDSTAAMGKVCFVQ